MLQPRYVVRFAITTAWLFASWDSPVVAGPTQVAQDSVQADDQERQTADRFLQVLLKRPRPGTALDRVYGFHVRNESLENLLTALKSPSKPEAAEFGLKDADPGSAKLILGLLQSQRGKSAAAVDALKQAEKLLPDDAVCSFYLGKAHLAIGETELAAAAMERAIEREPAKNEALPIFTELGRIYGRAGAADKALEVWTRLEKLFPGDSRVGGQIAATLADEGNVEEAQKRFEALSKSARKDDDKIAFAVQAAEMKRRLGQPKEATNDLETILNKLRPGSWLYTDVRNRIEDGFLKSGNVDALADYYQTRLKDDADNLELMTRLGRILVSAGRLKEAQTILNSAVERAPEDVEVRLALVDVLERQSRIAEAGQQYEQLAKQDPTNPDYLLKWGQLLLDDQDRKLADRRTSAAEIWQKLADARSDDAVTLAQVADRMRSIDQTEKAIALYEQAVDLDPAAPQYREYLGEYLHQLDRKDEAIKVWEAIAAGDRRNADSLIRLAEIYATFKLSERSLDSWKAATEFDLTFSQELRYAHQLRAAKQYDAALERLVVAEKIAETPDERDQLLTDRITTYSEAGTLPQKIAALEEVSDVTVGQLRELALMHQAAGQLTNASVAINRALKKNTHHQGVLVVAADIFEKQNRFFDAIACYRKLADAERAKRIKNLERVAQLQTRTGDIAEALKTCDEIIQTNPASTRTYLFAARMAFQLGRNKEGIAILRRAMSVAQRDTEPRKLLAAELAKQFRTSEAIKVYWEALHLETKTGNRIEIVRRLTPLYERQSDFRSLLDRLKHYPVSDNDRADVQWMLAAAHEGAKDYAAAEKDLQVVLERKPRDLILLEELVRVSELAKQPEDAIDYQKRIVALSGTYENRFRLSNLRLNAGKIDFATALKERLALASDVSDLIPMIHRAVRQREFDSAIMVARETLRQDNSLWDVKLLLAQLLARDVQLAFSDELQTLCDEIVDLNLPPASQAPSLKTSLVAAGTSTGATQINWSQKLRPLPSQLQNFLTRVVGTSSRTRTRTRTRTTSNDVRLIQAETYGQAFVVATILDLKNRSSNVTFGKRSAWMRDQLNEQFLLPEDPKEITDAWQILRHRSLVACLGIIEAQAAQASVRSSSYVFTPSITYASGSQRQLITSRQIAIQLSGIHLQFSSVDDLSPLEWRLFELSPSENQSQIRWYLASRLSVHHQLQQIAEKALKEVQAYGMQVVQENRPLDRKQLQLLSSYFVDQYGSGALKTGTTANSGWSSDKYNLALTLEYEFRLAGHEIMADRFAEEARLKNPDYVQLLAAAEVQRSFGNETAAAELSRALLSELRKTIAIHAEQQRPLPSSMVRNQSYSPFGMYSGWNMGMEVVDPFEDFEKRVAICSFQNSISGRSGNSNQISAIQTAASPFRGGPFQVSSYRSTAFSSGSTPWQQLSVLPQLIDPQLAQNLYGLFPFAMTPNGRPRPSVPAGLRRPPAGNSRPGQYPGSTITYSFSGNHVIVPTQLLEESVGQSTTAQELVDWLLEERPDIPAYEQRTRRELAAFVWHTNKQTQKEFDLIQQLAYDFPDDSSIQMQLGGVAMTLKKYDLAFEILDATEPLSREYRILKYRTMLHAAAQQEDQSGMRQVGQQLAAMNLDTSVAIPVCSILISNNLQPEAITILTRTRNRITAGVSNGRELMTIASSLLAANAEDAAAEIATNVLLDLAANSGSKDANAARQSAVKLLTQMERLQPFIEAVRSQYLTEPTNGQALQKLLRLYRATGLTTEKAMLVQKLFNEQSEIETRQSVEVAHQVRDVGEYKLATMMYLAAAKADPSVMEDIEKHLRKMVAVGFRKTVMVGLCEIPAERIPVSLIDSILQKASQYRFGDYNQLTDSEQRFVQHVLAQHATQEFASRSWVVGVWLTMPEEIRRQQPESLLHAIVSTAELLDSSAQHWNYRDGQQPKGTALSIRPLLNLVRSNQKVRLTFLDGLDKAIERRTHDVLQEAQILKSLVNLLVAVDSKQSSDTAAASDELLALLETCQDDRRANTEENKGPRPNVSGPFLWQVSAIVEETADFESKNQLLQSVYKAYLVGSDAKSDASMQMAVPKLLQCHDKAGDHDFGVNLLLDLDRQNPAPKNPSVNTVYKYVKQRLWFAQQLENADGILEALSIVRQERFANRRSPATELLTRTHVLLDLQAAEDSLMEKANSQLATAHLHRLRKAIQDTGLSTDQDAAAEELSRHLNYVLLTPSAFHNESTVPTFLIAARLAGQSQEGQKELLALDSALNDLRKNGGENLSALGMQIAISTVLNEDQIPERTAQFTKQLTAQLKETEAKTVTGTADVRTAVGVVATIANGGQKDSPEFNELLNEVVDSALAKNDFQAALLLTERWADQSTFPTRHIGRVDPDGILKIDDLQLLNELLKSAHTEILRGNLPASTRAFRTALAMQPPEFCQWVTSSRGGSAADKNRHIGPHQQARDEAWQSIRNTMGKYQDFAKSVMSEPEPIAESKRLELDLLVDTLFEVVFDPRHPKCVNAYAIETIPSYGRNSLGIHFFKNGLVQPTSLRHMLIETAAYTQRLNELKPKSLANSLPAALMDVRRAHYLQHEEVYRSLLALDDLVNSEWSKIEADSLAELAQAKDENSEAVIEWSARKSELANHVLHATKAFGFAKPRDASKSWLLADKMRKTTLKHLESDRYTAYRLNRIINTLQSSLRHDGN